MNNHIVPTIERSTNGLVVTSETIAQGAGVQHKNVLELIEKHRARVERFGQVAFETRAGYNNAQVRVALLNEQQSTLIMSFMRNTEQVMDFKEALVDGFFKMAEQLNNAPALTEEQIVAQALQITVAKVQALESKIERDAPKVDYIDTFVADDDLLTFRTVASNLKISELELRFALMYSGWIYKQDRTRWSEKAQAKVKVSRYSAMADKKQYFQPVMNHEAPRFGGEVMHTLKITAPGVSAVSRLVRKLEARHGSLRDALLDLEASYNERKAS